MNFTQARELAGFSSLRRAAKAIGAPGIDFGTLSKIERGYVLPAPRAIPKFEEAYSAPRESFISPEDVDYGIRPRAAKRAVATGEGEDYKLTVKVPLKKAAGLKEKVRAAGFKSITEFVIKCIEDLDKPVQEEECKGVFDPEAFRKDKNSAQPAATSKGAEVNNQVNFSIGKGGLSSGYDL